MDETLIVKARRGNEEALLELFDRYRPVIRSIRARYFLRDFDEQDWFQEALIIFNRCLYEYKGEQETTLGGFFKRSFENEIVSLVRKNCAYKRKSSEGLVSYNQNFFVDNLKERIIQRSYTDDPLEQLIVQETLEESESLLTELESEAFCGFFYGNVTSPSPHKSDVLRSAYDRSKRKITQQLALPDL
ncbi:sigma-70 family RNA polymerase sigma factor [Tetragenococcus koreensis]|uniref:DNA-directed RNA polymerase sigma-70 factor n=1 Tax=Tetragenococcus koreensis TaxID=290335 RepID=A0AAN4UDT0_9ENTE|nr:sigma-70 family RNA polymerase sigma factor [Tetragenococcus koreensis]AYW46302.1 sigma-70 family RNA polymerase sigma factor [Tetragenococcus koreensis]MCF1585753.1 sigma-70 family RNA polymerase sigma factor [Tetragenococcus koreensis]MCF1614833.1 sigma-70 family RNA polymerase sigma factor [Tetragenococcus koreensis]MCF1616938.1 sigma-70 family RNA polymerase sigma factor [Tetragenococcus koreensis]MCF1619388.1 sigma-70 family RNA polymerase sigma factor [Tetragenococcus koreensis]